MQSRLSSEDRQWLQDHQKELPPPIDQHFLCVVPGKRERILFQERDQARVGGKRIVVFSFSQLDSQGAEGEVFNFEESLYRDFATEFNRFRGADEDEALWMYWELDFFDECFSEAMLYFWGQRHRIICSRVRYFEAKGDKREATRWRRERARTKRIIRDIRHDAYRSGERSLTNKQRVVLDLLRTGLPQAEIARALGISRSAVCKHVGRVRESTGGRATADILGAAPNPTGPGVIHLQQTGRPRRVRKRRSVDRGFPAVPQTKLNNLPE